MEGCCWSTSPPPLSRRTHLLARVSCARAFCVLFVVVVVVVVVVAVVVVVENE